MKAAEMRRSIRKYKSAPVEESLVLELLRSATLAPSGHNTQPWHFIIVDDEDMKNRIADVSHKQAWMKAAPIYVVCVADIRVRINDESEVKVDEETGLFALKQIIRDTAIAVEHLILEAVDRGLGTCWVAYYDQDKLRPLLGIPEDKYAVGIVTLGYPDESPEPRPRKKIEEIIHRNRW